jgi:hypothetical protein
MKKTIFMIAATTSLVFASCGNKVEKTEGEAAAVEAQAAPEAEVAPEPEAEASIVGTWKLSDIDMGMEVPKGKEKQFEEMKAKMISKMAYTFKEDGTMSMKTPMFDKEMTGTYKLEDSKLTVTTDDTKKAETINVDELTANKLVLSTEQGGRKAVMTFSK